jgi:hypothetical protein
MISRHTMTFISRLPRRCHGSIRISALELICQCHRTSTWRHTGLPMRYRRPHRRVAVKVARESSQGSECDTDIQDRVFRMSTSGILVHKEGCIVINMMIHAECDDAYTITFELRVRQRLYCCSFDIDLERLAGPYLHTTYRHNVCYTESFVRCSHLVTVSKNASKIDECGLVK